MNMAYRYSKTNRMSTYFYQEKWILVVIALTGTIYNIGMTAGPWFEGQLAGYLCDIIGGKRKSAEMLTLAIWYVAVILIVQGMRFCKRLYVRKFANNINRTMKEVLYANLIHKGKKEIEQESTGTMMTKAVADVDACVEGMRKFTTEVFDTGVVLIAYLVMLFVYDWRLTLIVILFPPVAYVIAEKMKGVVTRSAAASKESAGKLNGATLDRVTNAITYRVYGQDRNQNEYYEEYLNDYERKSAFANIWETSLQPIYQIISMIGAIFILWLGGRNVLQQGWTTWDIAAFSTYLACYTKLSLKSSKAAKLFNAVQKAQVSWNRIKPLLDDPMPNQEAKDYEADELIIKGLSFAYPESKVILKDVTISGKPGQIIGITGEVASGKSTLGKALLQEYPYFGELSFGGEALPQVGVVGYLGHQPELFSGTIEENILLGDSLTDSAKDLLTDSAKDSLTDSAKDSLTDSAKDSLIDSAKDKDKLAEVLRIVCMDEEVRSLPNGIHTRIGNGGVRLSGGQQARIALARTLFHKKPVMVLDDPFSAVDKKTENEILLRIREYAGDSIILLISHRLSLFPTLDKVVWLDKAKAYSSTHDRLMQDNQVYRKLYQMQDNQVYRKLYQMQDNQVYRKLYQMQTSGEETDCTEAQGQGGEL